MAKTRFVVAAILVIAPCFLTKAIADPYISDVDLGFLSDLDREYLDDSGHVLRYRVVAVDSGNLQSSLATLPDDVGIGEPATIVLQMFDDVSLIARVISRKGGRFKVAVHLAGATCDSESDSNDSNGSLEFSNLGHVVGRFWVCDQIYTIGPIRELTIPYHVVSMLDPENLPSID